MCRNQFPFCFIHKIDPSNNTLLLKFQLCDYKETKISFEECESSPHKVLLPPGNYTVSEGNETIGEYVTGKSDKWIILNFKWETNPSFKEMLQDKENFIILRFRIHAEYVRLVEESKLSYVTEIKFKFN